MKKFSNTFKKNKIIEFFKVFLSLIDDSLAGIRKALLRGFSLLLDERRYHIYFKDAELITKIKTMLLTDEEYTVRRTLLHFLLKVKDIYDKSNNTFRVINFFEETVKINYLEIVSLQDIATALSVS